MTKIGDPITKEQLDFITAAKTFCYIILPTSSYIYERAHMALMYKVLLESEKSKECSPPDNKPGWYWINCIKPQQLTVKSEPRYYDGRFWLSLGLSINPVVAYNNYFWRYDRECK